MSSEVALAHKDKLAAMEVLRTTLSRRWNAAAMHQMSAEEEKLSNPTFMTLCLAQEKAVAAASSSDDASLEALESSRKLWKAEEALLTTEAMSSLEDRVLGDKEMTSPEISRMNRMNRMNDLQVLESMIKEENDMRTKAEARLAAMRASLSDLDRLSDQAETAVNASWVISRQAHDFSSGTTPDLGQDQFEIAALESMLEEEEDLLRQVESKVNVLQNLVPVTLQPVIPHYPTPETRKPEVIIPEISSPESPGSYGELGGSKPIRPPRSLWEISCSRSPQTESASPSPNKTKSAKSLGHVVVESLEPACRPRQARQASQKTPESGMKDWTSRRQNSNRALTVEQKVASKYLYSSALEGDWQSMQSAMYQGGDVNHIPAAALKRESVLHLAVDQGNIAIVRILLSAGADTNAETQPLLLTPLHLAASIGNEEVASTLIKGGANATLCSRSGHSPAEIAYMCNYKRLAALLARTEGKQQEAQEYVANVKQDDQSQSQPTRNSRSPQKSSSPQNEIRERGSDDWKRWKLRKRHILPSQRDSNVTESTNIKFLNRDTDSVNTHNTAGDHGPKVHKMLTALAQSPILNDAARHNALEAPEPPVPMMTNAAFEAVLHKAFNMACESSDDSQLLSQLRVVFDEMDSNCDGKVSQQALLLALTTNAKLQSCLGLSIPKVRGRRPSPAPSNRAGRHRIMDRITL